MELNVYAKVNSGLQDQAPPNENSARGGDSNGWLVGVSSPSSCLVLAAVPNARTENLLNNSTDGLKEDLGAHRSTTHA
eukprot:8894626-Pyramimonas_sp.AAC.1